MPHRFVKPTLLFLASLTVVSGAAVSPALPQMFEAFKHLPQADLLVRLVLTMPAIFIAVLAPLAGILIDRFGRKPILVISLALYGIAGTSGVFLDNLTDLLIARAFHGIAIAGLMPAVTTLVADYFTGEERTRFMGHQSAFMALGGMVFIIAGGWLADFSWRGPFLVYATAFLLLPISMWVLHEPDHIADQGTEQAIMDKPFRPSIVLIIYTTAFLIMGLFYMIPVQLPFYLRQDPSVSNLMVGVAIASYTVMAGMLSLGYRWVRARWSFPWIYAIGFTFMGLGYGVVALSDSYAQVMGGMLLSGVGGGFLFPNTGLWVAAVAPARLRGRLMGGLTTAYFLGQFSSPFLLQPLTSDGSLGLAFGLAAVFMGGLACIFGLGHWWVKREIKLSP